MITRRLRVVRGFFFSSIKPTQQPFSRLFKSSIEKKETRLPFGPADSVVYGALPVALMLYSHYQYSLWVEAEQIINDVRKLFDGAHHVLPDKLEDLRANKYQKYRITGTFDHSKEVYFGPQGRIVSESGEYEGKVIPRFESNAGFFVITPFKLKDRDETVLVNRGWVHKSIQEPEFRKIGQVEGTVSFDVIFKCYLECENLPKPSSRDIFHYLSIEKFVAKTGSSPIYFESLDTFEGGPEGGQVYIDVDDHHFSKGMISFSLSASLVLCGIACLIFR